MKKKRGLNIFMLIKLVTITVISKELLAQFWLLMPRPWLMCPVEAMSPGKKTEGTSCRRFKRGKVFLLVAERTRMEGSGFINVGKIAIVRWFCWPSYFLYDDSFETKAKLFALPKA